MKRVYLFSIVLFAALFTNLSFAANSNPTTTETTFFGGKIILPAGTPVELQLAEEIRSEDIYVNNTIRFKVDNEVSKNGKTLIASDVYSTGKIKKVTRAASGKIAEIWITVETVKAVDGTMVKLDSDVHVQRCNMIGEEGVINMMTNVTAHVKSDTPIRP